MNMKKYAKGDSRFLGAADVDDEGQMILTISHVSTEEMRDGTLKAVLHFSDNEKGLTLNVTNTKKLVEAYGEESEQWTGLHVKLYGVDTEFAGDTVRGVRVACKRPDAGKVSSTNGQPSNDPTELAPIPPPQGQEPPPPSDDFAPAEEDSIPF